MLRYATTTSLRSRLNSARKNTSYRKDSQDGFSEKTSQDSDHDNFYEDGD